MDVLTTMETTYSEDDVANIFRVVVLESRGENSTIEKSTWSFSKSQILRYHWYLTKRVWRILKLNQPHLPVANVLQDWDINPTDGDRRRRNIRIQRSRTVRRRGEKEKKTSIRKRRKAVKLYSTDIWSSIIYGVRQYDSKNYSRILRSVWPSDLPRHRHYDWHGTTSKSYQLSASVQFLSKTPLLGRDQDIAPISSQSEEASPHCSPIRQVSLETRTRSHVERRYNAHRTTLNLTQSWQGDRWKYADDIITNILVELIWS